ncbi:DUF6999 family protein [Paenibacillus nasutitermitis]|uniref:Uncharacterized protein n=1 Tax=Paenibacillus nasutitermitis TaxID=1652958 RepID=A0A916YXY8_9BACL|nr:hypothetical protein [Paenibacillus nasutitermitis]GGD66602.1 hypothetical protein GCM10010911_25440 [Paenibacillus nasutitermitis]
MSTPEYFYEMEHNPKDPNPFLAIFLDRSIPFDESAKAAFLKDSSTKSRQFLLPLLRPFARLSIIVIKLIRTILPNAFASSKLLHKLLHWGLKTFVSPEANYMILRHFILGSEILRFIRDNVPGVDVKLNPLTPYNLEAVKDDLFLIHDLNIYNFIINLNKEMKEKGIEIQHQKKLNMDGITLEPHPIEPLPKRWSNKIDLLTAIEFFTPIYQLFLTDNDFWRASNSLQLDEIVGIYASTIVNEPQRLALVNNKHPMVPLITLQAGYRLVLHGLATEQLHAMLVQKKRELLGLPKL